jgi:hypothetical protein
LLERGGPVRKPNGRLFGLWIHLYITLRKPDSVRVLPERYLQFDRLPSSLARSAPWRRKLLRMRLTESAGSSTSPL